MIRSERQTGLGAFSQSEFPSSQDLPGAKSTCSIKSERRVRKRCGGAGERMIATLDVQVGGEDDAPGFNNGGTLPHPEPSRVEVLEGVVLLRQNAELFHERFQVRIRFATEPQSSQ